MRRTPKDERPDGPRRSWWYRRFGSRDGLIQLLVGLVVVLALTVAAWALAWSTIPALHDEHCVTKPGVEGCEYPSDLW